MKRLLVLVLVLVISTTANATVINVVAFDVAGSEGRLGTNDTTDRLQPGDVIGLKIVLNPNPGSFPSGTYPSYDGYVLGGMNLTLTADVGDMYVDTNKKCGVDWMENPDWSFKGSPMLVNNVLSMGAAGYGSVAPTAGVTNGIDTWNGSANVVTDLLGGMRIACDNTGDISLSWGLDENGSGHYYDYVGDGLVADPVQKQITLADLGYADGLADGLGATIYAAPEPMTIALLGLGGLFLRRRK